MCPSGLRPGGGRDADRRDSANGQAWLDSSRWKAFSVSAELYGLDSRSAVLPCVAFIWRTWAGDGDVQLCFTPETIEGSPVTVVMRASSGVNAANFSRGLRKASGWAREESPVRLQSIAALTLETGPLRFRYEMRAGESGLAVQRWAEDATEEQSAGASSTCRLLLEMLAGEDAAWNRTDLAYVPTFGHVPLARDTAVSCADGPLDEGVRRAMSARAGEAALSTAAPGAAIGSTGRGASGAGGPIGPSSFWGAMTVRSRCAATVSGSSWARTRSLLNRHPLVRQFSVCASQGTKHDMHLRHPRALLGHRPQTLRGHVPLFRATETAFRNSRLGMGVDDAQETRHLGWTDPVDGGIEQIMVPGHHYDVVHASAARKAAQAPNEAPQKRGTL